MMNLPSIRDESHIIQLEGNIIKDTWSSLTTGIESFPIFTCEQWSNLDAYKDHYMSFCIAEKAVDGTAIVTICVTLYQLFLYRIVRKISVKSDFRIWIIYVSCLNAILGFIYHALIDKLWKVPTLMLF